MTRNHTGSCHCGAITFEVTSDLSELTTCDCSLCRKKNALMTKVHENQFKLLSGSAALTEYRWNMQIAKHYFCAICGIYTFHRKRAQPDHYGINIHCLEGVDPNSIPVRATEGVSMSVLEDSGRPEWPGPRVAEHD